MDIKRTLTGILAGTAITVGAGLAGDALAQEIVKPEVLKPTPVEEKQAPEKKEPKQEKEAVQETSEPFDDSELCDDETPAPALGKNFKTGQLRLNAFNSEDLDRLEASAKLVFAGKNKSRLNLYSLVSGIEGKGEEGVEDLNTTFQRHGIGFGKYINLDQAVLYPELQAFYERADHESEPTGKVDLKCDNFLFGGKLGYSNKSTGTKVLAQALFGRGDAEGQVSPTKPYDDAVERLRFGLTFKQRLTPLLQAGESGLSLRLDALLDKTNYQGLQKDKIASLRFGMPYVLQFKDDKSLTVEPFLTWRKEQTRYDDGKNVCDDYFGGGIAFKYRVGNFELCLIPGYDEEHGWNTNFGIVWYFGAEKGKK